MVDKPAGILDYPDGWINLEPIIGCCDEPAEPWATRIPDDKVERMLQSVTAKEVNHPDTAYTSGDMSDVSSADEVIQVNATMSQQQVDRSQENEDIYANGMDDSLPETVASTRVDIMPENFEGIPMDFDDGADPWTSTTEARHTSI